MHVCNVMRCEYRMECNERQGKAAHCNVMYIYIWLYYIYICVCVCWFCAHLIGFTWVRTPGPPQNQWDCFRSLSFHPPRFGSDLPFESYHAFYPPEDKKILQDLPGHIFSCSEPFIFWWQRWPQPVTTTKYTSSMLKLPMSGVSWGWNGFVLRDISNIAN